MNVHQFPSDAGEKLEELVAIIDYKYRWPGKGVNYGKQLSHGDCIQHPDCLAARAPKARGWEKVKKKQTSGALIRWRRV